MIVCLKTLSELLSAIQDFEVDVEVEDQAAIYRRHTYKASAQWVH